MTITAGTRLGPYEIVAPIGAGGMGEVWRALDTRLDRSVAIKAFLLSSAIKANSSCGSSRSQGLVWIEQIRRLLDLTPDERLQRFIASARNVPEMVASARPV